MLTKRSMLEIVHEILEAEGRKKTQIMYRTSLTYPKAIRYLSALTDRGLLQTQNDGNGGEVYRLTDRGRELRTHLDAVIGYLGLGGASA